MNPKVFSQYCIYIACQMAGLFLKKRGSKSKKLMQWKTKGKRKKQKTKWKWRGMIKENTQNTKIRFSKKRSEIKIEIYCEK